MPHHSIPTPVSLGGARGGEVSIVEGVLMKEYSLALLCDPQGMIAQVLRNDAPLKDAVPGRLFPRLVEQSCRFKALNFLDEIRTHTAAVDWELNVSIEESPTTVHFSGGRLGEQLLIVGAANGQAVRQLYEDMLCINNEQIDLLRTVLKEKSQSSHSEPEPSLYNEISRLNNELVAMQRELAKKNAELERLNQEKNRFLGMAAHDLRNPLHVILSHSGFLLEEDPTALGSQYREFLETIYASSEFMSRLVDDLLDVARIEAGQLELELTAADLGALITKNVALNRMLAAKKSITINLHSEPLPVAIVDTAKIEQVLNNVIGNAVKFSPPGSTLEVQLTTLRDAGTPNSPPGRGKGRVTEAGDGCAVKTHPHPLPGGVLCEGILISVRDQGPGMSPEEQASLFQPFRRGRARGTGGEKSTGLGLAIVKRIVEGHGGKIWVESDVGAGTTFFVLLPLQPPEELL